MSWLFLIWRGLFHGESHALALVVINKDDRLHKTTRASTVYVIKQCAVSSLALLNHFTFILELDLNKIGVALYPVKQDIARFLG